MSSIIIRTLKEVIGILKKERLEWCLFGGLAMQAYGRIRATKDIDIMIAPGLDETSKLIELMEKYNFRFDEQKGITKMGNLELLRFFYADKDTGFKIYVDFVVVRTEFSKHIMLKKRRVDFLGLSVNIASLEDLILLKLLAERPVDTVDAQALWQENKKELNRNLLINWAKKLNIESRLNNLFKNA